MKLDFDRMRNLLRDFDFQKLFVEELGWSNPSSQRAVPFEADGEAV